MSKHEKKIIVRQRLGYTLFLVGIILLLGIWYLVRLPVVTDYMAHRLVKDPVRMVPQGSVVVAPADGTILYIKEITDGVIPEIVKEGVSVPMVDHLKMQSIQPIEKGYLIGIYMNTQGVHVNRAPLSGRIKEQVIFNGPHMNMTAAESKIILQQLIPGAVTARKLVGAKPFDIADEADYILKSARETLVLEDPDGRHHYIVRIADYYVGKILTWVDVGQEVETGQKLGMITWGSQTDLLLESIPGMKIEVGVGDYVYGGETILATY